MLKQEITVPGSHNCDAQTDMRPGVPSWHRKVNHEAKYPNPKSPITILLLACARVPKTAYPPPFFIREASALNLTEHLSGEERAAPAFNVI